MIQMSEEQLKAFLEKVKGDTSLQEKLKAAAIQTRKQSIETYDEAFRDQLIAE